MVLLESERPSGWEKADDKKKEQNDVKVNHNTKSNKNGVLFDTVSKIQ